MHAGESGPKKKRDAADHSRFEVSPLQEGHRKAVVDLNKMLLAAEQGHIGKAHGVNAKVICRQI